MSVQDTALSLLCASERRAFARRTERESVPLQGAADGLGARRKQGPRWRWGLLGAACGLLCWAGATAAQELPYKEPFDSLSTGVLHGQAGWQAERQNDAQVQTATVYAGGQAAVVATNTLVTHDFTNAAGTNVWVDFYARVPHPGNADPPALTGSVAAAFFVTDTGDIKATSNGSWVSLGYTVPADTWYRFTVNLDYENSKWALFVADSVPNKLSTIVATNLPFSSASTNEYLHRFRVKN